MRLLCPLTIANGTTLTISSTEGYNHMSTLSVDTIQGQTTGNVKLPAGCILQVLSTTKTDTFVTSSASSIDITGLSL